MNKIRRAHFLVFALLVGMPLVVGCSSNTTSPASSSGGAQSGGAGGGIAGAPATGGSATTGGSTVVTGNGGASSGGTANKGGTPVSGGMVAVSGGIAAITGGIVTGTGGASVAGGGTTAKSGGTPAGGGTVAAGGAPGSGGSAAGGSTTLPIGNRVRQIMPLDRTWLLNKGDAAGAEGAAFADSTWTKVNVPHDWSIEGPFTQTAATTGRGGYAPSGIGWYRNHFTLPASVTSGQQVYIEFDGVMSNSIVYLNGTQLGNHPYGYVSFRYDMTKGIKFGAENVIAVKTDTTSQPASRFYAGAGIYRHVRILATDPVHIDQWATYVTTPSPTTTSATVKVTTTVVNSGTASQSVTVQGNVTDPSGTALPGVTSAAQTIAAGASADFAFDVPVSSPKLWSPDSPSMYQLVTTVQVGGKAVDDDVTPFGIRTLAYDGATGLNINGKNYKFKGVCLHQDYHGLGLAAPQRAMQRRLAALKSIGTNAVRTAHDPPSPEFLDLADRMGILVMDEFFDVWTAHKYQDVGDFATYFNKASSTPTGMPAIPAGGTGSAWYQVDVTGVIMRDRNHPSIALYSAGNEIHDSISTRTPILTEIVRIAHKLDPGRAVTQALLQPQNSGDVTGATRNLVDVFGGNYRTAEVQTAMAMTPAKAGVLTEMGPETTTWSIITGAPALTGEFIWTGVDYLGEQDGGWPSTGGNGALFDELGVVRSSGISWSKLWGGTLTAIPSNGSAAGKVVLTPDHTTITTDLNDVSFVKAAVPSDTAVTFAITGPGTILAVDSGSSQQQTYRGNTRTSTGGLAYAIVQATGAGSITVTATASGLTAGTATITATDGVFIPCSGTCD